MANIVSKYTGSTSSTIVSMGSNIPLCWHQFLLFILKQRLLLNWELFATFLIISEKTLPQFLEYWVSEKSPTGFWMWEQDIFSAHLKLDFNSMASLHHHFAWRKFLEYQIHLYSDKITKPPSKASLFKKPSWILHCMSFLLVRIHSDSTLNWILREQRIKPLHK